MVSVNLRHCKIIDGFALTVERDFLLP